VLAKRLVVGPVREMVAVRLPGAITGSSSRMAESSPMRLAAYTGEIELAAKEVSLVGEKCVVDEVVVKRNNTLKNVGRFSRTNSVCLSLCVMSSVVGPLSRCLADGRLLSNSASH